MSMTDEQMLLRQTNIDQNSTEYSAGMHSTVFLKCCYLTAYLTNTNVSFLSVLFNLLLQPIHALKWRIICHVIHYDVSLQIIQKLSSSTSSSSSLATSLYNSSKSHPKIQSAVSASDYANIHASRKASSFKWQTSRHRHPFLQQST